MSLALRREQSFPPNESGSNSLTIRKCVPRLPPLWANYCHATPSWAVYRASAEYVDAAQQLEIGVDRLDPKSPLTDERLMLSAFPQGHVFSPQTSRLATLCRHSLVTKTNLPLPPQVRDLFGTQETTLWTCTALFADLSPDLLDSRPKSWLVGGVVLGAELDLGCQGDACRAHEGVLEVTMMRSNRPGERDDWSTLDFARAAASRLGELFSSAAPY